MLAYKFISQIDDDGKISIPDYLKNHYSTPIEIIILFPENKEIASDRISFFYNLIEKYNTIDEQDLVIDELYNNRLNNNERRFDFD